MDTTPRQLKLRSQTFLKKASWSEFLKVFNQIHNPLLTSVGVVEVKVDEKKDNNS